MAKSNYPDWVLKYKTKGVYINKVGDKFYLYRAHCVYDKETKKNIRVSDGYIGRVTKEDGFIPARDKVNGPVYVLEYGLYIFLSSLLIDVYSSLKNNKKRDSIMSLAIMKFIDEFDYQSTALSYIYKKSDSDDFKNDDVKNEAIRVSHMLEHFVSTRIDSKDWHYLLNALPSIHLVKINDKYYVSSYCDDLKRILNKYQVEVKFNG